MHASVQLEVRSLRSNCGPTRTDFELDTDEILRILDTIAEDFDTSRIFVSITAVNRCFALTSFASSPT